MKWNLRRQVLLKCHYKWHGAFSLMCPSPLQGTPATEIGQGSLSLNNTGLSWALPTSAAERFPCLAMGSCSPAVLRISIISHGSRTISVLQMHAAVLQTYEDFIVIKLKFMYHTFITLQQLFIMRRLLVQGILSKRGRVP